MTGFIENHFFNSLKSMTDRHFQLKNFAQALKKDSFRPRIQKKAPLVVQRKYTIFEGEL